MSGYVELDMTGRRTGVYRIESEESVGIGKTLSSRPHRGHDEIDDGRTGEEALDMSVRLLRFLVKF